MKRPPVIEPCLPSLADCPPAGSGWIHEIKHDGFRLLACRDADSVRLLTRNGNDFTARYPLIVKAVNALPVRSLRHRRRGRGVQWGGSVDLREAALASP